MRASSKIFLLAVGLISFASCCRYRPTNWEGRFIKYAPDSTYSRAVTTQGKNIFIGNSNGVIYRLNVKNGKSKRLNKQALPEIRDIAMTGKNKFVAMQSSDSSQLILQKNKREKVFPVSDHPVFLDGLDILPSGVGFLMGDPVDGYFSLFKTVDFGKTWSPIEPKLPAGKGEAGFAASGTNVQCLNDSTFIFVSGGLQSRFFKTTNQGTSWKSVALPFQHSEGSGAFSVHFMNENEGVVVGGDYTQPAKGEKSNFYTSDGGLTWKESTASPLGYRSCVIEYKGTLIACGTTGIDISTDKGLTWKKHIEGNYIALFVVRGEIFATIPGGKIKQVLL